MRCVVTIRIIRVIVVIGIGIGNSFVVIGVGNSFVVDVDVNYIG